MERLQKKEGKVEIFLGNMLLVGVIISAIFVLSGGILYLFQHGTNIPQYAAFVNDKGDLKGLSNILKGVCAFRSISIIYMGILLLIATPVLRVTFSVVAFLYEKDYLYVLFTLIVLAILLFSIFV